MSAGNLDSYDNLSFDGKHGPAAVSPEAADWHVLDELSARERTRILEAAQGTLARIARTRRETINGFTWNASIDPDVEDMPEWVLRVARVLGTVNLMTIIDPLLYAVVNAVNLMPREHNAEEIIAAIGYPEEPERDNVSLED